MKQLSTLLLGMYRQCRTVESNEYQERVLQLTKSEISFDAALWASGIMTERGPHMQHVFLHKRPPEMIDAYMKIWQGDTILPKVLQSVGTTFMQSSTDYKDPAVVEYLKAWDLGQMLSTVTIDPLTQLLTVISFYRSQGKPSFAEEERQLKESLMPHLVETWSVNRLTHMLSLSESVHRLKYASAAVDASGVLRAVDDRFATILRDEWAEWQGPHLPEGLMMNLGSSIPRAFVGNSIVIRANTIKDLILLRTRPKTSYDTLSVREHQISQLFANGQSQKEIAKVLEISPATVNNHITAIYAKLGIHDKAQLGYQVALFE